MHLVSRVHKPEHLLDVSRHEERLTFVLDEAESYLRQLTATGMDFDVVDLSLDEIFEAFVIGRTQDWSEQPARTPALSV